MARICEKCGKGTVIGASRKHRRGVAGKRWRKHVTPTPRTFKPNLQMVTLMVKGHKRRTRLCAKCIKRTKKNAPQTFASA